MEEKPNLSSGGFKTANSIEKAVRGYLKTGVFNRRNSSITLRM